MQSSTTIDCHYSSKHMLCAMEPLGFQCSNEFALQFVCIPEMRNSVIMYGQMFPEATFLFTSTDNMAELCLM